MEKRKKMGEDMVLSRQGKITETEGHLEGGKMQSRPALQPLASPTVVIAHVPSPP